MSNDVFQLRVTIFGIWPRIWRRILVPADFTFYQFHVAIQDAMGWKHRRPYVFHGFLNAPGLKIYLPQPAGLTPLSTIDYMIRDFLKEVEDRVIYEYDSMEHCIELECICLRSDVTRPLMCTGGERACPPDGIGGTSHYERHLMMVSDRNHPQHAACMAWLTAVGGPFNPEVFNHNSVVFTDAVSRFRNLQTPLYS